jgi:TolB-like protein/tetratricopeptide (TPR) repeat protein
MADRIRFDCYEVDLAAGQIYKRGVRLRLADQPFRVLASLLERPGQVVTREDLRHQLWPGEVFVDFDNLLNTAVAKLRNALGDSAGRPHFIETLPKRGYRFIAAVSEPVATLEPQPRRSTLLVLPFVNVSDDPAHEYFSDAMTDGLITELGSLAPNALALIARTTSMHYKGTQKTVARLGRELGVDYVVEGSMRRASDRVTLNVTLVRARDQMHVFAKRYEVELREMFGLQSSIAQDIAEHIGVSPVADALGSPLLGSPATRRGTRNTAAYEEYAQGRQHLSALTPQAFATARQHFEEAAARDPEFALAYDSLAEIYWYLGYMGFMSPRDAFSTGVLYAMRALEIDNTVGETHAMLALYHKLVDFDWPEVDRAMARALELSPTSPIVRTRYAFNALMPRGRLEAAVEELERALEWDPSSAFIRAHLAIVLVLWRRWDQAMQQARMVLQLEPNVYIAYLVIAVCCREQGMPDESIAAQRLAAELSGDSSAMLGWLGLALAVGGKEAEARTLLQRLHHTATTAYVPPTSIAWIHLGLREIDAAFEWLDRAVEARDQLIMPIRSYAILDPIRADPRFLAVLRKMHLDE